MAWFKGDDNLPFNSKILAADSAEDCWFYVCCLAHCARSLTDGFIADSAVPIVAPHVERPRDLAERLVALQLLRRVAGGYEVPDYLSYNPSRAQVDYERKTASRRKALHDDRDLIESIRARDGNSCRYCGQHVNWRDRKGTHGGTYDHVDPYGDNTLENVVVACRGCNSRKGQRTPDEAGMPLRQIPGRPRSDSVKSGSDHPSRPVPNEVLPSSSSDSSTGDAPADDDDAITAVLEAIADAKQARMAEPPRSPSRWRNKVIGNDRTEHGQAIAQLLAQFPKAPASLLAAHVLGEDTPNLNLYRLPDRQEPAA